MAATLTTAETLITTIAELAQFDGPELTAIVAVTGAMLHADVWGDLLSDGHLWLAAHFVTLVLNPSSAIGPITSRSIDKLSESYSVGAFDDAELGSTRYGRLHLMLLGSLRTQQSQSVGVEPVPFGLPDQRVH